jgi:hypothetical protein
MQFSGPVEIQQLTSTMHAATAGPFDDAHGIHE